MSDRETPAIDLNAPAEELFRVANELRRMAEEVCPGISTSDNDRRAALRPQTLGYMDPSWKLRDDTLPFRDKP